MFENLTVINMIESEGDWRSAWITTLRMLSVTTTSFEFGRPLFSGRADAKAHSSSSAEAGGAGCGLAKSNMDAGVVEVVAVDC